jgi:uncharacterized protein YajQ (UPF0234 family)
MSSGTADAPGAAPCIVPAMPTFDVVSQIDMQEVRNAVDQAMRELVNRFDFKGTKTEISLSDGEISIESSAEGRLEAAVDVLKTRLVKRGVSLKTLQGGAVKPAAGGRVTTTFTLTQGIPQDAAKELGKHIRDTKLKVQFQVQGDQLRIQGKKRDDLQEVIAELKTLDFRLPLQFVNFRD